MVAQIIAVSRTIGAGADSISQAVAEELGYRHLDREIIDEAARLAGATPDQVATAEEKQSWMSKILSRLAMVSDPAMGTPYIGTVAPDLMTREFQEFIISVIHEVAAEGNVVITAHAASIPLAGTPGLLRILITGSVQSRVERIAEENGVSVNEAAKMVKDSDSAREDYFKRFYNLHREEPTNYDLAINTDVIGDELACQTIVALARSMS